MRPHSFERARRRRPLAYLDCPVPASGRHVLRPCWTRRGFDLAIEIARMRAAPGWLLRGPHNDGRRRLAAPVVLIEPTLPGLAGWVARHNPNPARCSP